MPPDEAEAAEKLLTPRQLEVLELVAKGLPNREIARVLGIAPATVKHHVAAVIEALDVTNRTEAATRLHELGLGSASEGTAEELRVEGFGSRPPIAVLPFDNFSSDPEQAFLADGIVEDLITRLTDWRWFPVISRNSTFAYKGKSIDVRDVSRALGARYIIEGSVRRSGPQLRVTVQVIDGQNGEHLFAERYDRDFEDVLVLTDEIIDGVVATLEPALLKIEGLRAFADRPDRLDAEEMTARAYFHFAKNTIPDLFVAQSWVDRALERDPDLLMAQSLLGVIQFFFCLLAHRGGPMAPEERLHAAAERTLALDKTDPFAQISLAMDRFVHFDGPGAVAAAERTIERAPSLVWARAIRGMALLACGRPEESATALEEAIRLAPQDPLLPGMHVTLAIAMIQTGRVDEAGHQLRRAIDDGPELPFAYPMLAVWHTLRSEPDEARALVARAKEIDPDYDPARSARFFAPDDDSAAGIAGILARLTRED